MMLRLICCLYTETKPLGRSLTPCVAKSDHLSSLLQFSPVSFFCICPVGESALGGSQVETEVEKALKTESIFVSAIGD